MGKLDRCSSQGVGAAKYGSIHPLTKIDWLPHPGPRRVRKRGGIHTLADSLAPSERAPQPGHASWMWGVQEGGRRWQRRTYGAKPSAAKPPFTTPLNPCAARSATNPHKLLLLVGGFVARSRRQPIKLKVVGDVLLAWSCGRKTQPFPQRNRAVFRDRSYLDLGLGNLLLRRWGGGKTKARQNRKIFISPSEGGLRCTSGEANEHPAARLSALPTLGVRRGAGWLHSYRTTA